MADVSYTMICSILIRFEFIINETDEHLMETVTQRTCRFSCQSLPEYISCRKKVKIKKYFSPFLTEMNRKFLWNVVRNMEKKVVKN